MNIGIDFIGVTTPFYCNDGKGNFLLHKRSIECRDEQGRWDTGSGKLEFGLALEENVLKEVFEEYGCVGEIQERLPAHDIFRDQSGVKTHWVAVPFFIKVNRDEAKNNEPEKIDEIGWLAPTSKFLLAALREIFLSSLGFDEEVVLKHYDRVEMKRDEKISATPWDTLDFRRGSVASASEYPSTPSSLLLAPPKIQQYRG